MANSNYISVDALALYHSTLVSDVLSTYVPATRTVNSKALSADITLSASDVGAVATSAVGAASGVASLDSNGHVPASQLPGSVDQIYEAASKTNFPATGASDIIYIALDTNLCYRWGGTQYTEISPSLALGETEGTAYRGDRGKTAYDHSQVTSGNPHNVTAADVGAVPTTRTVNSKALSSDITLTAADVSAVPTTRTVNSKALSSDITLTAADVSAVPTTRTINSKALSSDITLTASDIGMTEADSTDIASIFSA